MTEVVVRDILDRKLSIGDYVVFHNNIYIVKGLPKLPKYSDSVIRIMLLHPSKTTRPVNKQSGSCCLIPQEDVLVWKLSNGFSS